MYIRNDYLNGKCTHREYYSQFVDEGIKSVVKRVIGVDKIMKSKDESFNDIKLKKWDSMVPFIGSEVVNKLEEAGDYLTISGVVCIFKEAAKQIKEEQINDIS